MFGYVFMKVLESSPQRYDTGISIISLGQINRIKKKIVEKYIMPGDNVLDIGCGTGTLAINMANKGAKVTGIDLSSAMLSLAKQRSNHLPPGSKIEFIEASAIEIDRLFPGECFDCVTSTLVFSELSSEEQEFVLKECYRILKKGGRIILADETSSANCFKRFIYALIRLPLVIITYIIAQSSTRPVKKLAEKVVNTGFEICQITNSCFDAFQVVCAQKNK